MRRRCAGGRPAGDQREGKPPARRHDSERFLATLRSCSCDTFASVLCHLALKARRRSRLNPLAPAAQRAPEQGPSRCRAGCWAGQASGRVNSKTGAGRTLLRRRPGASADAPGRRAELCRAVCRAVLRAVRRAVRPVSSHHARGAPVAHARWILGGLSAGSRCALGEEAAGEAERGVGRGGAGWRRVGAESCVQELEIKGGAGRHSGGTQATSGRCGIDGPGGASDRLGDAGFRPASPLRRAALGRKSGRKIGRKIGRKTGRPAAGEG